MPSVIAYFITVDKILFIWYIIWCFQNYFEITYDTFCTVKAFIYVTSYRIPQRISCMTSSMIMMSYLTSSTIIRHTWYHVWCHTCYGTMYMCDTKSWLDLISYMTSLSFLLEHMPSCQNTSNIEQLLQDISVQPPLAVVVPVAAVHPPRLLSYNIIILIILYYIILCCPRFQRLQRMETFHRWMRMQPTNSSKAYYHGKPYDDIML